MNLNHMEYFVAAGKLGSVSRASEQLCVSRSAISDAIKQLERELNGALFKRVGRNLQLTELGEMFLEGAEREIANISTLKQEALTIANQKHVIRLGTSALSGTILFPYLYSARSHFMDKIQLDLDSDKVENLLTQVAREKLDVCFYEGKPKPDSGEGLAYKKIYSSRMVLCVGEDNKLSDKKEISFEDICEEPVVMFKDGYQKQLVAEEYRRRGITPEVVFTSNQVYTISGFIQQNLGIGFMDASIARNLKEVRAIPMAEPMTYDIYAVWKETRSYIRYIREFIQYISELDYTLDHSRIREIRE